jgi:hypothetical protein
MSFADFWVEFALDRLFTFSRKSAASHRTNVETALKNIHRKMVARGVSRTRVTLGEREDQILGELGILAVLGIEVFPASVVNRNLHFLRVAMVHVLAASVVVSSVIVLRIIDVRVVIETVPILGVVRVPPLPPVSLLSGRLFGAESDREKGKNSK